MNQKLFNKDYLLHLCQKFGLKPSKQYGQNYLLDAEVVETMVMSAEVTKKDTVIEVGPGFGVLTFALADKAKKVVAFEIEKKLQNYWNEENKQLDNLEIIWGNVLREFPISNDHFPKYKVIANLPYQITSQIIRLFLEADNPPSVLVTMVQKEVAERICAKPGDMSLLSLSVQFYADAEIVATVPRALFWPEPAVDSAVIKLEIKKQRNLEISDNKKFFDLVKAGFAQKRKLLTKNLLPFIGKEKKDLLKSVFLQLGLVETVRAQELSLDQWAKMVKMLNI